MTAESLNERIGDFAALVGVVLVLVTLFTQQRSSRLGDLSGRVVLERRDWTTELYLDTALLLVTVGLFLAGLPIVVEAAKSFHPLRETGPLRGAFALVWALLIALIVWQASLVVRALDGRKKWDEDNPSGSKPESVEVDAGNSTSG
jgi:hypothetical protein